MAITRSSMKQGDMVRFKSAAVDVVNNPLPWRLGLLVEYHPWEKIATVLYEGRLLRCRAADVQKAGKKDGLTTFMKGQ